MNSSLQAADFEEQQSKGGGPGGSCSPSSNSAMDSHSSLTDAAERGGDGNAEVSASANYNSGCARYKVMSPVKLPICWSSCAITIPPCRRPFLNPPSSSSILRQSLLKQLLPFFILI